VTATPVLSAATLEQWTLFGAHWHLIEISEKHATVELCACTGEPVQRLQTHDPETIHYLRNTGDPNNPVA